VETLEAYGTETAGCTRCRLAQGRTQVVFGAGNPRDRFLAEFLDVLIGKFFQPDEWRRRLARGFEHLGPNRDGAPNSAMSVFPKVADHLFHHLQGGGGLAQPIRRFGQRFQTIRIARVFAAIKSLAAFQSDVQRLFGFFQALGHQQRLTKIQEERQPIATRKLVHRHRPRNRLAISFDRPIDLPQIEQDRAEFALGDGILRTGGAEFRARFLGGAKHGFFSFDSLSRLQKANGLARGGAGFSAGWTGRRHHYSMFNAGCGAGNHSGFRYGNSSSIMAGGWEFSRKRAGYRAMSSRGRYGPAGINGKGCVLDSKRCLAVFRARGKNQVRPSFLPVSN